MKTQCPNCGAKYNIDDSKIPEKGAYVNCAKCKTRFQIKKGPSEKVEGTPQEIITCPDCGHVNISSDRCSLCGKAFSEEEKNGLSIRI